MNVFKAIIYFIKSEKAWKLLKKSELCFISEYFDNVLNFFLQNSFKQSHCLPKENGNIHGKFLSKYVAF